jgi:predicted transcriptional regulator
MVMHRKKYVKMSSTGNANMPMSDPLLSLVARIVSAQVEHNHTPSQALPGLIRDVYEALAATGSRHVAHAELESASVRRGPGGQTVFDDHLICLDCGLHMKMLKRHLQSVHNSTPSEYRAKWRLSGDYPMVARQYAALRSSLAKESGLGKRPGSRGR